MKRPDEMTTEEKLIAAQENIGFYQRKLVELAAQKDAAYRERDLMVALAASACSAHGFHVGLGRHPDSDITWEEDWRNIVYIDLPNGQLSWHIHDSELLWFHELPKYEEEWDGHTTEEKYERLLAFLGVPALTHEDIPF